MALANPMRIEDPYGALKSDAARRTAVWLAITSEPAQYIRAQISDALADLLEEGLPTTDYARGYRHALRVAYLLAGGQCDGSELQWAQIEQQD